MSNPEPAHILLARPCHYDLPNDLIFVGLVRPKGKEIARIRFSRGSATILDIPVSAVTLANLIQALSPLHGIVPDDLLQGIDELHRQGDHILKE